MICRRKGLRVETYAGICHARCLMRKQFQFRGMRGYDARRTYLQQPLEHRDCERSAAARLRTATDLVDEYERLRVRLRNDLPHSPQVSGKRRRVFRYRLFVADVREYVRIVSDARTVCGGDLHTAVRHHSE